MANVEMLKRTLAWIEEHPEKWKQGVWRCQSGMCFAGVACELVGGVWAENPADEYSEFLLAEDEDDALYRIRLHGIGDVEVVSASQRATRVLGLTNRQACDLFSASNGMEAIREVVAEILEIEEGA